MKTVTVAISPKNIIRIERADVPRVLELYKFVVENSNGTLTEHFFVNQDMKEAPLILSDINDFDLDTPSGAHNYKTLKAYAAADDCPFRLIFDDPDEKAEAIQEESEKRLIVLTELRKHKDDIPMLKAIYRRVVQSSSAVYTPIGEHRLYSDLLSRANLSLDDFFIESNLFVTEGAHFHEYKFVDELIEVGLLVYKDNLIKDRTNAIFAENIEDARFRLEKNTALRSEYEQLLSIRRSNGVAYSAAKVNPLPENVVVSKETVSNVGNTDYNDLLGGAKNLLGDTSLEEATKVVEESIEAGNFFVEEKDNDVLYKITANSSVSLNKENMIKYLQGNPSLLNDLKDALTQELQA